MNKSGMRRRSLRLLDFALEIDPDNLGALLDRGQQLALSGTRTAEAAEPLERAVELYPGNPEVLHWYAHAIWSDSVETAEKLLLAILPFKPQEGDVLYDLACSRSLADDIAGSEEYLRAAIEAGYREWTSMEADGDLRSLRESGRFAAVLKEYRQ